MRHEDDHQRAIKENCETISDAIDELGSGHWSMGRRDYRSFWAHAKEIRELFKTVKPLARADREQLWNRLNELCNEIRQTQDNERDSARADSAEKRDLVMGKLDEAMNWAGGAQSKADFDRARELLGLAQEWMKDGWNGFSAGTQILTTSPGRMNREDREDCRERIRQVLHALDARRHELWQGNHAVLYARASEALNKAEYGLPREAKDLVKEVQEELRQAFLSREQRDEIRGLLDDAWQRASAKAKERHEEWRRQQEEQVERWRSQIDKNSDFIAHMERKIDEDRERQYNARGPDFADVVQGWIDDKRNKVRSAEDRNRELEAKIASVQERLRS